MGDQKMKTTKDPKKRFDREFKLDAARMVVAGGRTIGAVAADTGVCYATIRAWVAAYRKDQAGAFPGSGHMSVGDIQLKELMEENRKLKMQVGFLKKTMAYFVELPK
jgi:transposase